MLNIITSKKRGRVSYHLVKTENKTTKGDYAYFAFQVHTAVFKSTCRIERNVRLSLTILVRARSSKGKIVKDN